MKINRQFIRLSAISFFFLAGIIGMSFMIAPKETLKEIALRKQTEGKFIPVYLHPVKIIHQGVGADAATICSVSNATPVKDQFGTDYTATSFFEELTPDAYFAMSENIAKQLNEGLGTTAFKAVYAKDLPMKTIKFLGREDEIADWWQTEYDIVVNITATPAYVTRSAGSEYNTHFEFSSMLSVGTVESGKQALGNMGMPMNLGSLKSEMATHGGCLSSLDDLKETVGNPDILSSDCAGLGTDAVAKMVDRENKKYEKAMKKKK